MVQRGINKIKEGNIMSKNKTQKAKLVSKISTKTVCGKIDVKELIEAGDDGVKLYNVVGVATGTKSGESTFGPWEALTGNFQATRESDGQTFVGGNLFLPSAAHNMVSGQLTGEVGEQVEFAMQVSAVYDESAQCKYRFEIEPLLEPSNDSPLAKLAEKAGL